MAGVAGPMLRESRSTGVRFLIGLVLGSMIAGTVLALALVVTGGALGSVLPTPVREVIAALMLISLGLLDFLDRTPHIWRQVPQRFVRVLPAGQLGVIWGVDLGMLFTTQKTTSLIWGALVLSALLSPGSGIALALLVSLVASVGIGAISHLPFAGNRAGQPGKASVPKIRMLSGVALVAAGALAVTGLF